MQFPYNRAKKGGITLKKQVNWAKTGGITLKKQVIKPYQFDVNKPFYMTKPTSTKMYNK